MAIQTEDNDQSHQEGLIEHNIDEQKEDQIKVTTSFWHLCRKDKQYRVKVIRSLCIGLGFFCLGATEAQSGPTFLDIQIITNTDARTASVFFTVHSIGYLAGCILAGFLTKKFRRSLLIFIGLLAMAAVTVVTPYCFHLASMIAAKVAGGIFAGIVDPYLNADQMKLWGNQGQQFMQFLHFLFALGGLLSPLISAPFLAAKESETSLTLVGTTDYERNAFVTFEGNANFTAVNDSLWNLRVQNESYLVENHSYPLTTFATTLPRRKTNVHYAFLILGIITSLVSIPFFIIYLKERRQAKKVEVNSIEPKESDVIYRKIPKGLHCFLVINLSCFFLFYCGIEDTFSGLLMTFLVREYDNVSKSKGAHIVAIFWTCFATSRFLMVFLAKRFSPLQLLTACITLMVVSFVTFALIAGFGQITVITIVCGLIGFSMSAIFGAGFSWSESEYLRVTNTVSACILVFSSLGVMLNPMMVIFTMEQKGNMWFCYIFTVEILLLVLNFVIIVTLNRKYLDQKYGLLRTYNVNN